MPPGQVFGEAYASLPGEPMMVSAVAEKEILSRSEIDELYVALKKLEENCHD